MIEPLSPKDVPRENDRVLNERVERLVKLFNNQMAGMSWDGVSPIEVHLSALPSAYDDNPQSVAVFKSRLEDAGWDIEATSDAEFWIVTPKSLD